jgi:hypothetical protein
MISAPSSPSSLLRSLIAATIGLVSAALVYWSHRSIEQTLTDIPWAINAARDLLIGADPYRYDYSQGLVPYPLTAALIAFPFALLPGSLGLAALIGLGCGFAAFGLTSDERYWRLALFASPSFIMALHTAQWSTLFVVVYLFPALLPLLIAKPTMALPVLFSIPWRRASILVTAAAVALSLIIMPNWPWRWVAQIGGYAGFIPLLSPLGPALLLSLIGWASPPGRLLALMSVTPQHQLFYDQLLLWLIPQSPRQMLALTFSAWVAFFVVRLLYVSFWGAGPFLLVGLYLPALLIVLWQERARLRGFLMRLRLHIGAGL